MNYFRFRVAGCFGMLGGTASCLFRLCTDSGSCANYAVADTCELTKKLYNTGVQAVRI